MRLKILIFLIGSCLIYGQNSFNPGFPYQTLHANHLPLYNAAYFGDEHTDDFVFSTYMGKEGATKPKFFNSFMAVPLNDNEYNSTFGLKGQFYHFDNEYNTRQGLLSIIFAFQYDLGTNITARIGMAGGAIYYQTDYTPIPGYGNQPVLLNTQKFKINGDFGVLFYFGNQTKLGFSIVHTNNPEFNAYDAVRYDYFNGQQYNYQTTTIFRQRVYFTASTFFDYGENIIRINGILRLLSGGSQLYFNSYASDISTVIEFPFGVEAGINFKFNSNHYSGAIIAGYHFTDRLALRGAYNMRKKEYKDDFSTFELALAFQMFHYFVEE